MTETRYADATTRTADNYAPLARVLPIADRAQGLIMARLRRGVVRAVQRGGATRVLDVCGGTGAVCRLFARAGIEAVCADGSATMLRRAAAKARGAHRFDVVSTAADRLPFAGGFDAAVISLALHEMDPPVRDAVWREMSRVVRHGGLLVAVDFTHPEQPGRFARLAGAFIEKDERQIGGIHPPHYANYKEFMAQGGLMGWLGSRAAETVSQARYMWGNVGIVAVRRA